MHASLLLRGRRGLAQRISAARAESGVARARDEAGACAVSAHRCEECKQCFLTVDKLDRHRLCCLPDPSGVVVRSEKAFSGYEGVVSSQIRDKWEAFLVSDHGYGRKRRRIGETYETAEAAARAYATACREMLHAEAEAAAQTEAAAQAEAAAQGEPEVEARPCEGGPAAGAPAVSAEPQPSRP